MAIVSGGHVAALRGAAGGGVDVALLADSAKSRSVGGFVDRTEYFMGVLMRHLVLEHFDDLCPGGLEHKPSLEFDASSRAMPTTVQLVVVHQGQYGRHEAAPEEGSVEVAPRQKKMPKQGGFEFRGDGFWRGWISSGGARHG